MSDQRTDYYLGTYIILGIGSLVIFPIQDNSSWALQGHGTDHQRWKCSESVNWIFLVLITCCKGDHHGLPWLLRSLERVPLDAWHGRLADWPCFLFYFVFCLFFFVLQLFCICSLFTFPLPVLCLLDDHLLWRGCFRGSCLLSGTWKKSSSN